MNKKVLSAIVAFTMLFASGSSVSAKDKTPQLSETTSKADKSVFAYQRSDVTVVMNDKAYIFRDAAGNRVYPLIYAGTTYLPVRAVSAMLEKNIDWEQSNRTVYIGRSLKNSDSENIKKGSLKIESAVGVPISNYMQEIQEPVQVAMTVTDNIRVLYNFEERKFFDASGGRVYPAIFNYSTYLPVRAVSELINKDINWEQSTKTITISDKITEEEKAALEKKAREEEAAKREAEKQLEKEELAKKQREAFGLAAKTEYERLLEIHKLATDNLVALRKETNKEKQSMYLETITQTTKELELKKNYSELYRQKELTQEQEKIVKTLSEYSDILVHYTLIIENIAYFAVNDQDFSVFAETFVNFAVTAQQKQQNAKSLIGDYK